MALGLTRREGRVKKESRARIVLRCHPVEEAVLQSRAMYCL